MFSVQRVVALTFFGSDTLTEEDKYQEAWRAHDWLTEILMRGFGVHGPLIRIHDFSEDPPAETLDWIEVTSASVEQRPDKFGLWTVPVDLRYLVTRDEAEFIEEEPVDVTDVTLTHETGLIIERDIT